MEDVIIIGSGPAGYTAAIYCARARLNPVLFTGKVPGGQLTETTEIENYPGFPDAINGFDLMYKFQQQAEKFGTKVDFDSVSEVDFKNGGPHTVKTATGKELESKSVIIATGASPKWLGLESEERLKAKGVSACATCDGAFFKDVPVVVLGGGDSAMEEATFLTKFASKVTIIHRREKLRASKIMAEKAMENNKIEFAWNSVVTEILGENEVEGVRIKNVKTGEKSVLNCKGYFAALGHIPNTQIFNGISKDEKGYIILKNSSSHTNLEGVFASGDCADYTYRQAVTAAGMGCRAAMDAERWLESQK